ATAAALSALTAADSGDASSGGGNGFNPQGGGAQAQDLTNLAALLQPAGSAATGKDFTNYLSAARGSAPSPTTQMVAVQMTQNISAGINTMSFQLEPAGLGRLDVKLKFAKDGSVKAHMTVDKPETLALLQKDSSHLQNALKQSGLHADENSLSFDLRQQNQQQNSNGYNNGGGRNAIAANGNTATAGALQAHIAVQAAGYISQSGVNIMV
ncbi:MAG: flagellar hook-length control protein FliK, partial [Alphaproteobacteria bacterium]|nr:flagellar hook-length control protein FliK [Alphaproteobacteria bacterium]